MFQDKLIIKRTTQLLILLGLAFFSACAAKTEFPASNETKAEYLENEKEEFEQPRNDPDRYDRQSGKGGGIHKDRK